MKITAYVFYIFHLNNKIEICAPVILYLLETESKFSSLQDKFIFILLQILKNDKGFLKNIYYNIIVKYTTGYLTLKPLSGMQILLLQINLIVFFFFFLFGVTTYILRFYPISIYHLKK